MFDNRIQKPQQIKPPHFTGVNFMKKNLDLAILTIITGNN